MSKEATSFEGYVRCLEIEGEEIWALIQMVQPNIKLNNEPLSGEVLAHCVPTQRQSHFSFSCYLLASELPGIKIGDKVQVALYLK